MEMINFLPEIKIACLKSCSQNPGSITAKLLHVLKLLPGSKPSWQEPTFHPWLPTLSRDSNSLLEKSGLPREADWRHSKQAKGREEGQEERLPCWTELLNLVYHQQQQQQAFAQSCPRAEEPGQSPATRELLFQAAQPHLALSPQEG